MPLVAEKALEATRSVEIEFGGQTLKAEILRSRFTPIAVAKSEREATAKARNLERIGRPLVIAVSAAREAYVHAEAAKIAGGKVSDPDAPPVPTDEEIQALAKALDDAQDALADFEDQQQEEPTVTLSGQIAESLVSWDAVYQDGTPVPLEKDAIAQALPWQLVMKIVDAINEAAAPEKKS